jgi:DNA polymerase-3 subunit beta
MPFKITIQRNVLFQEMAIAMAVAERRTTVPILTHVLLETAERGEHAVLRVTASDLDHTHIGLCAAQIVSGGRVMVPARRLYDAMRFLPEGTLEVSSETNDWVTIRTGRKRLRMPSMSAENFPKHDAFPEKMGELHAHSLKRILNTTFFAVSNEEQRYQMKAAKLIASEHGISMVATDGHRLAFTAEAVPYTAEAISPLVPRKTLTILQQLLDSGDDAALSIGQNDSNLFFRYGNRGLVARKPSGAFPPNFQAMILEPTGAGIIFPRKELFYALNRVTQFSSGNTCGVKVTVKQDTAILSSDSEDGACEEQIAVVRESATNGDGAAQDQTLVASFNGAYLLEYLAAMDFASSVCLEMNGPAKPALFHPHPNFADEKFRYVVMPLHPHK